MEERCIVRRMDKNYPWFHQREVKLKLKYAPFPHGNKKMTIENYLVHICILNCALGIYSL